MRAELVDPHSPQWNATIDQIGAQLHAGQNPALFPYHFLQVVLPKLGGHITWLLERDERVGVGFLFPRYMLRRPGDDSPPPPVPAYTLRYHAILQAGAPTPELAQAATAAVAAQLNCPHITFYDPLGNDHTYSGSTQVIHNVDMGRPYADEAPQIPALHHHIWGSPPEYLYPADIHSDQFAAGTSLVARVDGRLVGFLFGFFKFGGPDLPTDWETRFRGRLRLESQTMGVHPDYRGMRIGNLLKRLQAEQARQAGIAVVNWTADPLQFANAALNFGLLRALAFHHYPDFYPFRNALNRVPASRFALTWLVESARVRDIPLTGARTLMLDLTQHPHIQRVNDGWWQVDYTATNDLIAVEIPADWTAIQQRNLEEAIRWRSATDRVFTHYVGTRPGQYVITGVATAGDRRYLLGQQVSDGLWKQLGHVDPQPED